VILPASFGRNTTATEGSEDRSIFEFREAANGKIQVL
jgi:hypothetical protein